MLNVVFLIISLQYAMFYVSSIWVCQCPLNLIAGTARQFPRIPWYVFMPTYYREYLNSTGYLVISITSAKHKQAHFKNFIESDRRFTQRLTIAKFHWLFSTGDWRPWATGPAMKSSLLLYRAHFWTRQSRHVKKNTTIKCTNFDYSYRM